ncbi:hypothetical protein [Kocuria salsicia]|uniref:hypothetical protein n=1 Tax=Kocuria salsicia TaxID=664639 RepID=UPI0011A5AB4A|nr:hypothetical protein [Kocuria salsicia]
MVTTVYPGPAVYERRLFQPRVGVADAESIVSWVQGERLYCDVRSTVAPDGRRRFRMGFAGPLHHHPATGEVEWEHAIAAGAAFGAADVGRLAPIPGWGLLETGRDLDYVELWERDETADGPVLEYLGRDERGRAGLFVSVGDRCGLALADDAVEGRPASVHLGRRRGHEWIAQHTAWASDPPFGFAITPGTGAGFSISWRTGAPTTADIHFHHDWSTP